MTNEIANAISEYGFPIVAAIGMGGFIYYVWKWVTTEIKPVLADANTTLIKLVDKIRMLDNDMIRLNTKLSIVLEYRSQILDPEESKEINEIISRNKSISEVITTDDKENNEK